MLDAGRREKPASCIQASLTKNRRPVYSRKPPLDFDQHVQAGQKAEGICAAVIVKNRIVGDDRPAFRKRLKRLAEQRFLLGPRSQSCRMWPITITSVFGNASTKKSPAPRTRPGPRVCGWRRNPRIPVERGEGRSRCREDADEPGATMTGSSPCAVPRSMKVAWLFQSNFLGDREGPGPRSARSLRAKSRAIAPASRTSPRRSRPLRPCLHSGVRQI